MERELPKKVGIMGGTFDPIHIGHLLLAQQACAQFALDKVLFMPSSQPPHKDTRQVTSAVHRQAMTKLAVQGNSGSYILIWSFSEPGPLIRAIP